MIIWTLITVNLVGSVFEHKKLTVTGLYNLLTYAKAKILYFLRLFYLCDGASTNISSILVSYMYLQQLIIMLIGRYDFQFVCTFSHIDCEFYQLDKHLFESDLVAEHNIRQSTDLLSLLLYEQPISIWIAVKSRSIFLWCFQGREVKLVDDF